MNNPTGQITTYLDFLDASPSPFHAADEVARQLTESGFARVHETRPWPKDSGSYFLLRDGAIISWVIPDQLQEGAGFSIWGCHTDSPTFKLKPTPQRFTQDGWGQLCVEVYGGMLYNSWLDRELVLAGAVYDKTGAPHLVRTKAIARIPQLAIHLDRAANDGLKLDPQEHLQPVWTTDEPDAQVLDAVASAAGLGSASDIVSFELYTATAQGAETFGDHQQFVAAGRQDNLSSVFAGLHGILAARSHPSGNQISVFAAFDHEEVGSSTRTGAGGTLLKDVLTRTAAALGLDLDSTAQMIASSNCISADAGHSVHPNYPQAHDPDTRPVLGRGPLLKLNAKQRYSTDGRGAALWAQVCQSANISRQEFVSNNSVPCGSTIGPIIATSLGIVTVDVGIGLLSMHSAREMSHFEDVRALKRAAQTYLRGDF